MITQGPNNLNNPNKSASESCSVCQDLLINMQRFLDMLGSASESTTPKPEWLTVDDIAKELRISKSIVYRLIRKGELEAVNLVEKNGEISQKGHYRIERLSLKQYLEHKKVKPFPNTSKHRTQPRHFPKVKNHLGL